MDPVVDAAGQGGHGRQDLGLCNQWGYIGGAIVAVSSLQEDVVMLGRGIAANHGGARPVGDGPVLHLRFPHSEDVVEPDTPHSGVWRHTVEVVGEAAVAEQLPFPVAGL